MGHDLGPSFLSASDGLIDPFVATGGMSVESSLDLTTPGMISSSRLPEGRAMGKEPGPKSSRSSGVRVVESILAWRPAHR